MCMEIKDKVFLITGGATGIGASMVKEFFKKGAKFVACLDIAEEDGFKLEKELNGESQNKDNYVKFFKCDITDDEEVDKVFDNILEHHGYIDVIINNAGIMNDKIFKTEIKVNFLALVTITLKAYKLMKIDEGGKGGTIINISSVTGLRQAPSMPVYFATKAAILQFSNCLGLTYNYERTGVRVIVVCFGATATELIKDTKTGFIDDGMKHFYDTLISNVPIQKQESAMKAVIHAFEHGASGSTWLAHSDEPPMEYTDRVKAAYKSLFSYNLETE